MTAQTPVASDLYYYYDSHPTPEDLMGETTAHSQLIRYLIAVLEWQFRAERWFIGDNLNLYQTGDRNERPIVPDIALFQGCVLAPPPARLPRSWRILPPENPPPTVVFEIASQETREKDIREKPGIYASMGVREYFYYDPDDERVNPPPPLLGWRMENGLAVPMDLTIQGGLWSEELESWLVPDGRFLRLYDPLGQQRPTEAEAAQAEKEAAQAAKEAERAAKERAWARLRELGIDPESLA
jgi:Uma2 family endonuclease